MTNPTTPHPAASPSTNPAAPTSHASHADSPPPDTPPTEELAGADLAADPTTANPAGDRLAVDAAGDKPAGDKPAGDPATGQPAAEHLATPALNSEAGTPQSDSASAEDETAEDAPSDEQRSAAEGPADGGLAGDPALDEPPGGEPAGDPATGDPAGGEPAGDSAPGQPAGEHPAAPALNSEAGTPESGSASAEDETVEDVPSDEQRSAVDDGIDEDSTQSEDAAPAEDGAPADDSASADDDVPADDDVLGEDGVPAHDDVPAEGGVSAGGEEHLPPGQTAVPLGDEVVVDDETMRRALEAILMVTDEPLPVLTLARAVGRPTGDVADALVQLAGEYTDQGRGFDLREIGGGWRYYTRAEAAPYVERFVLDGQQARLTQAALETLSVVAYKQPVSRARVSAIRGVNVDGVMRTLVARGLVEEAGADTDSQATLYRTTTYFLERMGMQSLDDLPELAPYLPDMDDIEEELAAQSLPPADSPEPGTPTSDEPPATSGAEEAASDGGDRATATDELAAEGAPAVSAEADLDETDEASVDTDEDQAGTPASGEADGVSENDFGEDGSYDAGDVGIDGDLVVDEAVELDVEHKEDALTPSDEMGASDETDPTDADVLTREDEPAEDESAVGGGQPAGDDSGEGVRDGG
ncbi:SMC-Scp complex subunit ScpB [Kribbella sp. NPDC026611]|uniref:SMC-Scp complex subunit ScpB n=1 Tax=Kribbella sp. NPDC026611 TaxID=3154911 RepID=UPI00340D579D